MEEVKMNKAVNATALVAAIVLLASNLCYAQGAREASPATISHTRTNFTHVGVTGLDTLGNPGYLAMTPAKESAADLRVEYYVWVDETGDLCIASHPTIVRFASFPDGNWTLDNMGTACSKVGSQS